MRHVRSYITCVNFYDYVGHDFKTVNVGSKSTCEIAPPTWEGSVRLFNSTSTGIVQIYHNGQWGTMCSKVSLSFVGQIVCRQLGYSIFKQLTHTDR